MSPIELLCHLVGKFIFIFLSFDPANVVFSKPAHPITTAIASHTHEFLAFCDA